jgi:ABC-type multidrug transport system fused ATPase/permease subunit
MKKKMKFTEWTCFKLCFKSDPVMTIYTILNTLILCLIPLVKIFAIAKFIDASVAVVTTGNSMKTVIGPIVLVVIAMGYTYLQRSVSGVAWLKIEAGLRKEYGLMQIKKIAALKYMHIENPKTLNLIRRINNDGAAIKEVFKCILWAIVVLSEILSVFITITSASVITGLLALAVSVPLFFVAIKAGKLRYDTEKDVTKYKRQYEYINNIVSNREAADERSLFESSSIMEEKWKNAYEEFRKRSVWQIIKNNIHLEGASVITSILTIIIAALLLVSYYQNKMTIGLFLSLFAAVISLIETMSWNFTGTVSSITNNHQYLKEVDEFFKLSEEKGALEEAGSTTIINTIELKNVRFKYPGTDYYVLDGMSMKLERGKHYAFVGSNGAGKTTIIKLLTGLYRDYEGDINLNDKELRQYSLQELKAMFSIVYQDYAKYQVAMGDNIQFGNMNCTEKDINKAIEVGGLQSVVQRMKKGLDTPLGKVLEDGQDLSGGEWQRIALARSLVNNKAIQILDEPTAALDPIMENKVYEEFSKVSKDRTTIFISHRLGSTKMADIIFVIDSGRVAEFGTHESLMLNGQIYEKMYTSQRKWYE